ncbi:MAG TPA: YceI family protein [Acidimicrobiia bacterium]|nr:YceI family protein [Acidimicrobiia bacterium]
MTDSYTYDPDAWHPVVAGLVAGAIAAIVAGILSAILRSPDEVVANSLTVALTSLALGVVAGALWRRIRLADNARRLFGWTMAGGWLVSMLAVTIVDQTVLSNLVAYAAPIAAIIFITLAFLIPILSTVTAPLWIVVVAVLAALALGIGLFGRGNVASGELSLDDLDTVTTTTVPSTSVTTTTLDGEPADTSTSTTTETTTVPPISGTLAIPEDLAASYTIVTGLATYSVEERLQGLSTQGVGTTDQISGTVSPTGPYTFTIDLQSFTSDQSRRDSRVVGWFAEFPEGTFSGESFALPDAAEVGEIVTFDIDGDMTVNGITEPVTWAIEARLEADGSISVAGETFIVLSEFDVPVVTEGFVEMEDGATIEVVFSAVPSP